MFAHGSSHLRSHLRCCFAIQGDTTVLLPLHVSAAPKLCHRACGCARHAFAPRVVFCTSTCKRGLCIMLYGIWGPQCCVSHSPCAVTTTVVYDVRRCTPILQVEYSPVPVLVLADHVAMTRRVEYPYHARPETRAPVCAAGGKTLS
jgi:hypothetical protein